MKIEKGAAVRGKPMEPKKPAGPQQTKEPAKPGMPPKQRPTTK